MAGLYSKCREREIQDQHRYCQDEWKYFFFMRARSEGVCMCVPTIFTSKSNVYFIVLGALTKCLSVCPSVRPHGTTRLSLDGFS